MKPVFEKSLERNVLFALQLLDAVTLEGLNSGITVKANGLVGSPRTNKSGMFVWLKEDLSAMKSVSIETGDLPYQSLNLDASQVKVPLTMIQMAPRVNYPIPAGLTALRGTLIESRTNPQPVLDAEVHLRWLDETGNWQDATPASKTAADKGDFLAILRLLPSDSPQIDASKISLQVQAKRRSSPPLNSGLLKVLPGRVPDPMTFAWDELEP